MKQALLCVSFGTTVPSARESIDAVEAALRDAVPGRAFARAYTSSIIRRILRGRGEDIPSCAEALDQLREQGFTDVLVQPTHFLPGVEFDKLRDEAAARSGDFQRLTVGRPLLSEPEDLHRLATVLNEVYPPVPGEALVLFGHGTSHFANAVYPALQTVFSLTGRDDVLVGTVEGWPGYGDVEEQLRDSGVRAAHIVPLMLVAGDHALNDMSGSDPDSWQSRLEAAGFAVRCDLRGMGMLPGVRQMYREHLAALAADGR